MQYETLHSLLKIIKSFILATVELKEKHRASWDCTGGMPINPALVRDTDNWPMQQQYSYETKPVCTKINLSGEYHYSIFPKIQKHNIFLIFLLWARPTD